jgi:hypothetical protein
LPRFDDKALGTPEVPGNALSPERVQKVCSRVTILTLAFGISEY